MNSYDTKRVVSALILSVVFYGGAAQAGVVTGGALLSLFGLGLAGLGFFRRRQAGSQV